MDQLIVTLTDKRQIDGFVTYANTNGITPEAACLESLGETGKRYADTYNIAVVTSAAFVGRFTPTEYAGIIAAAETIPEVAALVSEVMGNAYIYLDDARLGLGLDLLEAEGLIAAGRKAEIVSYDRPEPTPEPPVGEDTVAGGTGEGE